MFFMQLLICKNLQVPGTGLGAGTCLGRTYVRPVTTELAAEGTGQSVSKTRMLFAVGHEGEGGGFLEKRTFQVEIWRVRMWRSHLLGPGELHRKRER